MDRAKAIFDLEAMATNLTGEYATEASDKRAEGIKRKIDAIDEAKAALKEQEKRDKGCEFCNVDYAVMTGSRLTRDLKHMGCDAKFCPNCGRKLGGADHAD